MALHFGERDFLAVVRGNVMAMADYGKDGLRMFIEERYF